MRERSHATSQDEWNAVDQLPEGASYLPESVVESLTQPFGNSTNQNRSSGLVSTGAVVRVSDRRP